MSPRLTREQRREQTRNAMVHAARTLFESRGYDACSVQEICDYAGYSAAAMYEYFPSKEHLLLAVLPEQLTEQRAKTLATYLRTALKAIQGGSPPLFANS